MIKKLKQILNSYTDEELEDMELWINSDDVVEQLLINEDSIDLITSNMQIRMYDFGEKEISNGRY